MPSARSETQERESVSATEYWTDRSSTAMPIMRLATSVFIVGRHGKIVTPGDVADMFIIDDLALDKAEDTADRWIGKQLSRRLIESHNPDDPEEYTVVAGPGPDAELHDWFSPLTDTEREEVADLAYTVIAERTKKRNRNFTYVVWKMLREARDAVPFRAEVIDVVEDELDAYEEQERPRAAEIEPEVGVDGQTQLPLPDPPVEEPPPEEGDSQSFLPPSDGLPHSPAEFLLFRLRQRQQAERVAQTQKSDSPKAFHDQLLAYAKDNALEFGPHGFQEEPHRTFFLALAGLPPLDNNTLFTAVKMMTIYSAGPVTKANERAAEVLRDCGLIQTEGGRWSRL